MLKAVSAPGRSAWGGALGSWNLGLGLELVDFFQDRQLSLDLLILPRRVPGVLDLSDGRSKGIADVGVRIVQPLFQGWNGGLGFEPYGGQASGGNAADVFVFVFFKHLDQGGHDLVA